MKRFLPEKRWPFFRIKDDLLKLLVVAWGIVMWSCVEVILGGKKPLAVGIHFFLFAAVGAAGLCDVIFIAARSLGRRRNWKDACIGVALLVALTLVESVVLSWP